MYILESGIKSPADHKKAKVNEADLSGKSYNFEPLKFYISKGYKGNLPEA